MSPVNPLLVTAPAWYVQLGGFGALGIAAAAVLSLLAWWLYRRQLRGASRFRRTALPVLRGLAVFVIGLMLAEPSLEWSRTIERQGRVVLLTDSSPSMHVPDLQMPVGQKVLIAQSLGFADVSSIDFTPADLAERLRTATGEEWQEAVALVAALPESYFVAELPRGHATVERWERVGGHEVVEFSRQDLRGRPVTEVHPVASLEFPEDVADHFARRVTGRLHPPVSGEYIFRLAADATAELRLSTDEDVANLRSIVRADVKTAAGDRETHVSDPIALTAGEAYTFELLHKDSSGPDHLTLWWGQADETPRVPAGLELSPAADPPEPAVLREAFLDDLQQVTEIEELPQELRDEFADQLLAYWNRSLAAALADDDATIATAVQAFDALTREDRSKLVLRDQLEPALKQYATVVQRDIASEGLTDLVTPLSDLRATPDVPTGVILLSDGRHTRRTVDATQAAVEAKRLGEADIAIHTVVVGSTQPPNDVAVLDVVGPTFVGREDPVSGRVVLLDTLLPGTPVRIEALVEGEDEILQVLWSQDLTATGGGRREVEFEFQPPEVICEEVAETANEVLLPVAIRVAAVPGELSEENNVAALPLRIALRRGRVLLLDGRPRWDSRYVEAALERESRFDVTSLLTMGSGEDLAEGFPESEEELREYDVIVFGEVPAEAFTDEQLEWLETFVTVRGGGMVFIDGQRGLLSEFADTPVATLLPVYRGDGPPIAASDLRLTNVGRGSGVLRLEPEAERNTSGWGDLPTPTWTLDAAVKPGVGEVLAELVGEDDRARPAVVTAPVGRGRVWYVGFDETWRWRKDAENRWQSRFWSGLINAAAEPPFSAEDEHLAVGVDQAAVEAGEEIGVRVRVKDDEGQIISGEALAEMQIEAQLLRDGKAVASVPLTPDAAGGGLLRASFEAPAEPGVYEVAVFAERPSDPQEDPRATVLVTAQDVQAELARLDADLSQLEALSDASGGRVFSEANAHEVPALFEGFSSTATLNGRYDVWTSWPLFAAVVGLLGMEWFIRRRGGMM